jgi:SMC interacting uncharacterized protein involved in chromosome segregation
MAESLKGVVHPFAKEPVVADTTRIRRFVKELFEVAETVRDARSDLKEAVDSNIEIESIDEKIKVLKEERKEVIEGSASIQGYSNALKDAMEDKRQLISDAKQDGVPKKEIDTAIKMLKSDIDPKLTTEVYANIASLV